MIAVMYVKFKLVISEDHEDYDIVTAEFTVTPDEAFDIVNKYVVDPDKKKGFLNKIITLDERLDTRQKHVQELGELDKLVESIMQKS